MSYFSEYFIALLNIVEKINNNATFLPYHKICLRPVIISITQEKIPILTIIDDLINQDDTAVIIDVTWDQISLFIHNIILSYSIPVIRFSELGYFHSIPIDDIVNKLEMIDDANITESHKILLAHEEFLAFWYKHTFNVSPTLMKMARVIDGLLHHFGWKTVGLITERLPGARDENGHEVFSQYSKYELN